VIIFSNDHEPTHVHVLGDGEAKINLVGLGDRPELVWAVGMSETKSGAQWRWLRSIAMRCGASRCVSDTMEGNPWLT
jgi:hypothetical protein